MLQSFKPRFCGSIWPNGEFGVSRQKETPFLSQFKNELTSDETQFNTAALQAHGFDSTINFQRQKKGYCLLGLSQVPNSHKKVKRGLKGISSYGAKVVRCAAQHLETRHTKECLSFTTVTVPDCTADTLRLVAAGWAECVRQFVQSLRRDLRAQGLSGEVLTVTEVQSKRYASSGLPVLHLHLLFQGRIHRRAAWAISTERFDELWARRLRPYFPNRRTFPASCNMKSVEKSAAGYMGKYMSKGRGAIAPLVEAGCADYLPSAWWNCTLTLRHTVLKMRIKLQSVAELLELLCCNGSPELFAWLRPIEIDVGNGTKIRIGWAGRIHPDWLSTVYGQCAAMRA